ncbi:MAG: glycosyltransferase family 9 protein, partial [Candidatus Binatia bacterium]
AVHYLRCVAPHRAHDVPAEVRLRLREEIVESVRRRLSSRLDLAARPLVLHPGSGGRGKRWSRVGFEQIAERWLRRRRQVIAVLGPAERDEGPAWDRHGIKVLSDLDLLDVAVLLGASGAYLGNDSGLSHLAAVMGSSGVALFGPTDPLRWRPLSPRIVSLRAEPWRGFDEPVPRAVLDAVDDALAAAVRAGETGTSP